MPVVSPISAVVAGAIAVGAIVLGNAATLAAQTKVPPIGMRPPTPVLDVAMAAREPFAYWVEVHFDEGSGAYMQTEPFMVPKGKQLVIEYANAVACAQPDEKMSINLKATYDIRDQQGSQELKILLQEQGVFMEPAGAYMHFGATQPMKIYVQSGQSFNFAVWRSGGGDFKIQGHAEAAVWISGYLAPAGQ